MPPFRNPFGRKPPVPNGVSTVQDENLGPASTNDSDKESQRGSYANSRASSSLSIKARREEPTEYKLSVVNDSGPSPPEKKGFWQRSPTSTNLNSNHRSLLSENEPFSISRESFESYRRSFDISARSPIQYPQDSTTPRQSLESRMSHQPRSAINGSGAFEHSKTSDDEGFEDVGLNDETKLPPKKRGIFARFGDSSENQAAGESGRPNSSHGRFHLPGRKRGQSGQGAELGNIDRPKDEESESGAVR
ncbi:MAG: hypothetical protein Q9195_002948 [Heterodermia aff. obscurata]